MTFKLLYVTMPNISCRWSWIQTCLMAYQIPSFFGRDLSHLTVIRFITKVRMCVFLWCDQNLLEAGPAHVVENLLPDYVKGDLSALCVWPDQIRHWYKYRWTSHLHYIDTPDQACSYEYSSKSQPRHFQITLIRFLIILNRS